MSKKTLILSGIFGIMTKEPFRLRKEIWPVTFPVIMWDGRFKDIKINEEKIDESTKHRSERMKNFKDY